MSEKKIFKEEDLNVPEGILDESKIKDTLNIEGAVFLQLQKVSISAVQDEIIFAANVRILLSMLPKFKRDAIETRQDEYTSIVKEWKWKYWCGVPLGTPEEPINGSPELIEEEVTDWHRVFQLCMESLEESGITWQRDTWLVETLKPEKERRVEAPPTPVFEAKNVESSPSNIEQAEQPSHIQTCAICSQRVTKGQGIRIYNSQENRMRLVHRDKCKSIAIVQWKVL